MSDISLSNSNRSSDASIASSVNEVAVQSLLLKVRKPKTAPMTILL